MRTAVVTASIAFVLLACSAFDGESTSNVAPPPNDAATDDGHDSAAPPILEAGVVDAGTDAPSCELKTLTGVVDEDTALLDCSGNSYGSEGEVNIGVNSGDGLAIFRFRFDDATVKKVAELNLRSIVLHLTANVQCGTPCGTGLETQAGTMQAHVARNDWAEGVTGGGSVGADACRRGTGSAGSGWGTDGPWSTSTHISSPVDYDALAFQVQIAAAQHEVDIPISDLGARGKKLLEAEQEISFVVEMPAGGRFVVATKESVLEAPKLTMTYCE